MIFPVKPRTLVGATFLKFLAGNVELICWICTNSIWKAIYTNWNYFLLVISLSQYNMCSYWLCKIFLLDDFMIYGWLIHANLFLKFTNPGISFFLTENDSAFDLLYCITFKLMDHEWLAMHASYMDFNVCHLEPWNRQIYRLNTARYIHSFSVFYVLHSINIPSNFRLRLETFNFCCYSTQLLEIIDPYNLP